jgi:hypothetical protein
VPRPVGRGPGWGDPGPPGPWPSGRRGATAAGPGDPSDEPARVRRVLRVDASSTVTLDAIIVSGNQADGGARGLAGPGGPAGDDGAGIGGGVYLAGPDSTKQGTRIFGNTASTSKNDLYGRFGSG